MILGLNRVYMGAPDALIPGNCRKSRPGPNGTSPGAQNPKIRIKKYKISLNPAGSRILDPGYRVHVGRLKANFLEAGSCLIGGSVGWRPQGKKV